MIFFTGDTHLGHRNIIKYQWRPFMSPEEIDALSSASNRHEEKAVRISDETLERHDTTIIDNINAVVKPGDTLYHLGDFCFGKTDAARAYRDRINCGNVWLIKGNHDRPDTQDFWKLFVKTKDLHTVKVDGQKIMLCHYPMLSWNGSYYGSWHLHGHCHGSLEKFVEDHDLGHMKRVDVGVDSHDFKPWSMDELAETMDTKKGMGLVKK